MQAPANTAVAEQVAIKRKARLFSRMILNHIPKNGGPKTLECL